MSRALDVALGVAALVAVAMLVLFLIGALE